MSADSSTASGMHEKLQLLYKTAKTPQDIFPDVPAGALLWEKILEVWGVPE
jgi:hypothetical protein